MLVRQLREGHTAPKNLASVAQLATHIGEVELAIEAMRMAVVPGSLGSLLAYWAALATHGRADAALADLTRQSSAVRNDPFVLHFRATAESELGHFDEAEALFRRALAGAPTSMRTWFALAMLKTFQPGDPDFAAMEQLERQDVGDPEARASLRYALGKACEDCGDIDRAFDYFERGAALRRQQRPFDIEPFVLAAERALSSFTPDGLSTLKRSGFEGQRSLFVTGLPRSGTTLTEQILLGHSAVKDAAEFNLFGAALIPARGNFDGAIAYQQSSDLADPWGEIARDYANLVDSYFPSTELVVDKSLGQSLLIGLMLHAMPDARIAWLRRAPDDVALSCFKTYFTTGLPWTSSLPDIADFMRAEDRLFDHWRTLFPDRILVVPFEDLVASPAQWAERLQRHFGLPIEAGIEQLPERGRAIRTASVGQAREVISTSRIGQAAAYARHLKPFRDRYYA